MSSGALAHSGQHLLDSIAVGVGHVDDYNRVLSLSLLDSLHRIRHDAVSVVARRERQDGEFYTRKIIS
jgi:hypothetical protein